MDGQYEDGEQIMTKKWQYYSTVSIDKISISQKEISWEGQLIKISSFTITWIDQFNFHGPITSLGRYFFKIQLITWLTPCRIVGGGYTCTLNAIVDKGECNHVNQVVASSPLNKDLVMPIVDHKGANVLLEMMEARYIEDIWRHGNPGMKNFHGAIIVTRAT